jgi:hypothetical protein
MSRSIHALRVLFTALFASVILLAAVPAQQASAAPPSEPGDRCTTTVMTPNGPVTIWVPCPTAPPIVPPQPPNNTQDPSLPSNETQRNDSDGDGTPDDKEDGPDCVALAQERASLDAELTDLFYQLTQRKIEVIENEQGLVELTSTAMNLERQINELQIKIIELEREKSRRGTSEDVIRIANNWIAKYTLQIEELNNQLQPINQAIDAKRAHIHWLENTVIPDLEGKIAAVQAKIDEIDRQCGGLV